MFDVPDNIAADSTITITKELVAQRLSGLVKNRDLSQYIL
jgi:ATP-dependent HslUV protease ATP-binding subunit HslU